MKRSKKLIVLAAVLAVLVIVTLVVQNIVTKNEEAATEAEDTSVTFLTVDADAVTALGWTYNDETVNLTDTDGTWADEDDAAFPVDATYPDAMLDVLNEVTASRAFKSDDTSEYGLDAPAYTITISAGTDTTLLIGDTSEISGEYYASIGDGNIYLVASDLVDPFTYGLWDILQMETIPDMSALSGIDISTASGDLSLVKLEDSNYSYTDAYTWFLQQSYSCDALGDAADTLADSLTGLSWASCVSYNATEEDLATYGLDDPNATVVMYYTQDSDDDSDTTTAEAETFTLEIGGFTDDGYYARIQGSNMVYLIDSTLAQSIFSADYDSLRPTDVCLLDWDTVSSFEVTLDGETYAFERSTKDVTDDDGNVTTENIFLMNGEEVDSDLVNDVLDTIYSMSSTGTTDDTPGAAEITFAFHRDTDTFTDINLGFYRFNSSTCIVGFNGETRLAVARTDVVNLIEAVNAILLQ